MAGDAFGLASLYDPTIATDEAALQRQQQMAQALRQMSLEASGRTQMAGNVAIRNSPLEGVAKIVQALKANQLDTQNDTSRQALSSKTMAAMAQLLRGDQPGGLGGSQPPAPVSEAGAPPTMGAAPAAPMGGGMGLPDLLRGNVINSLGGSAMGGAYAERFKPTEIERKLDAAGIKDPLMRQQIIQQSLSKENYIPPTNARPGGYNIDPVTKAVTQFPQVPEGYQATQGPNGFSIAPVPGGPQAVAASATAKAEGPATFKPVQVWDTNANNGMGGMVYSTARNIGNGASPQAQPPVNIPPEVLARAQSGQPFNASQAPGGSVQFGAPPPAAVNVTQPPRQGSGAGFAAAPPLGVQAGAEAAAKGSQDAVDKIWEPLKAQGREALNTKSYLQNIVQAAEKGAITGPGADRREMIQGFLQLAGINEKVNTDAVTQTQLLDKYHNQIVARLGQGGLGTDAARSILDSAYPGKAMNIDAIREAAGNLGGAQDMTNAKIRFLQEAAISRNAPELQRREIQFDQAADPRIWQWRAMPAGPAKDAFAKSLMVQDPTVRDRIKTLTGIGAL